MKTLHLLIIVTATMVSLVAFGIYVIVHPLFGGIAPSPTFKGYIQIDTPGLEKTYKIGQPINFSVLIQGFGLYPCQSPQIAIYNNDQTKPVFYYTTQSVSCPDPSEHYFFYFPSQNNTFSTMINKTGNYTVKVSIGQDSYQKQFSVTAYDITGIYDTGVTPLSTVSSHNNIVISDNYFYYGPTHQSPKVELYDHPYEGIDKNNAIVSINNQTYYQTTLNYTIDNLTKGISVKFQNVAFTFPEGIMNTPGGSMILLDVKLPDGSEEIYGQHKVNPDGSGVISGISIPVRYGLSNARNSTTVLGYHVLPQAGLTIFHDTIKLLVSTEKQAITTGDKTNPLGVLALIIYHPPGVCLGPCPPNTFYLKINSVTTAYLMGYIICDGDSCAKTSDLSVLLPIKDALRPNFQMIGLPEDLHWKYGDVVKIQLYVSSTNDTDTASLLDLGNSIIVP